MRSLCQQYISDVKSFFPVMGKEEKKYLANLMNTVEEYCIEENITTIDKLPQPLWHKMKMAVTGKPSFRMFLYPRQLQLLRQRRQLPGQKLHIIKTATAQPFGL